MTQLIFVAVVVGSIYLLFFSPEWVRSRVLNRYREVRRWLKEFGKPDPEGEAPLKTSVDRAGSRLIPVPQKRTRPKGREVRL